MSGLSSFTFIGNIARITPLERVTKVRAIANYDRKDETGERIRDPYPVSLTVFGEARRSFVETYLQVGDLISAEGRIKDDRYEKDGETRYETSLIVDRINFHARPDPKTRDAV